MRIVRMQEPHLREVFALIDDEHWSWEFAEIQQIHRLDPESSVVVLDGKEIVGLVTCINFGALAFIVHVIVKKGWRGKGIGIRMMEEVLSELDSGGISSVELHANPEAVEFYRQFSFKRLEDISFLAKEPPLHAPRAAPLGGVYSWLPAGASSVMSEALSSAAGYRKDDMVRALEKMPPNNCLARTEDGRTTAMLLSRTGFELNAAGPWVMDDPTIAHAEGMMKEMLSAVPAKRMDVMAPASNEIALTAFETCGFSVVKAGIVRVVRSSERVGPFPRSVLAIGHLGLI